MTARYNPPPNWPAPPVGWTPAPGWAPDPSWGPPPQGWQLWVEDGIDDPAAAPPLESSPLDRPTGSSWPARHKVLTGIGAVVVLFILIGALNGGNDDEESPGVASTQETQKDAKTAEEIAAEDEASAQAEADRKAEEDAAAAAKAEEDRLAEEQRVADEAAAAAAAAAEAARIGSVAQQNAYRSAVNYLDFTDFSRTGLIEQLEYEGYATADGEFALARLEAEGGVDWNAQAAATAASYLEFTSFSRSGLLDQLIYEGFTPEQAEYGVGTTGL
ncbi:Ltp family lipoprotein [Cellulomonas soli]|uniref:Putative host cell surface-exposed lipoprotein Ltp-like HTH region domain-containing protein n=1 Tax=Cellulomonas soli TaxID=931535 RepID=A0A512PAN6_9CELL|nr:Ltp family lipoprotein [Cellulomonas soli]NYI57440.1 hypothetical protein [Cellulomonas soli]GEP68279.1 hypothetical protein CSO01_09940 [Cellulomonas soli]